MVVFHSFLLTFSRRYGFLGGGNVGILADSPINAVGGFDWTSICNWVLSLDKKKPVMLYKKGGCKPLNLQSKVACWQIPLAMEVCSAGEIIYKWRTFRCV